MPPPGKVEVLLFWALGIVVMILSGAVAIYASHLHVGTCIRSGLSRPSRAAERTSLAVSASGPIPDTTPGLGLSPAIQELFGRKVQPCGAADPRRLAAVSTRASICVSKRRLIVAVPVSSSRSA
jgi:hypothetical protein